MPDSDLPPDRRLARVASHLAGGRLDRFLAEHFPNYSRRQLTEAIKAGLVRVNGRRARPGTTLAADDELEIPVWSQVIPELERQRARRRPETEPDTIRELYRDDDLLVVHKPAGVPVHAGAGWAHGDTMLDLLKDDVLSDFGLVHRLDRDTTGVLLLAKGAALRKELAALFADPDAPLDKTYEAIVSGTPEEAEGVIELPLRPPPHRGRAEVDRELGKPARTDFEVVERFTRAARLRVRLRSGRTHQIRAHLRAIGFPLLVDPLYGRRKALRIAAPEGEAVHLRRTPLHASELTFPHPRTDEVITVRSPLPADMKAVLEVLRILTGRGRKTGGLPPAL